MSQVNISTTKVQYPLDAFFVLTVADTTGFVVGEKITGATTGATAKVSGIIDATKLRIKGMKPGASYNFCGATGATAENVTGATSSTTSSASALTLKNNLKRMNAAGSVVATDDNTYALDDTGFTVTSRNAHIGKQTFTAVRMGQSKSQTDDSATAPVWSFSIPASGNYSKAATPTLRFNMISNEAVTVSGSPRIAITFAGAGAQILAAGITSITGDGTTATVVTAAAHSYRVGQVVAVASMTTAGFNNATATITSVADNTHFTYANATSGACTIGSGTITLNALQYGFYTSGASNAEKLVFDYVMTGAEANGAVASIAYNANGATLTDVGGTTFTPTWNPTTTGIVITA